MRKVLVLSSLAIFVAMFAGCTVGGGSGELTAKIDKLTETVKTLETDLGTVKANLDSLVVKYDEHIKATTGRTGGTTGGTGSTGTPGSTTPKLPPKTQIR